MHKAPTSSSRGGFVIPHRKTANAFGRAKGRFFILSFFCSSGQPSIGAPLTPIIPCISVNGKFIGERNRQHLLFHFTEDIYILGKYC